MIYYIYDKLNNAVKIGYAKNVRMRFTGYYTHNINPLLLVTIEEGSLKKEKEIHVQYEPLKIRTEWFKCEQNLLKMLIVKYGKDFTKINSEDYERLNDDFFKTNTKSGYTQYVEYMSAYYKNDSRRRYEKERRVEKLTKHMVNAGEILDNLFIKNDEKYIIAKLLPEYLEKHNVMSCKGEKTLRATKIAKYFGVKLQSKRIDGKIERCIIGLDYAK